MSGEDNIFARLLRTGYYEEFVHFGCIDVSLPMYVVSLIVQERN